MSEITMIPSSEHSSERPKYGFCLATWFAAAAIGVLGVRMAEAHPPVSVVMDSRGVVFFSDLQNVWMILPDGTKSIAVGGVHTHELWIDGDDNLYGEDVVNQGELYRHRVWVRAPDGHVRDDLPWRSGHPTEYNDYSFVRDGRGRSYVLIRNERRIDVRTDAGVARSIDVSDTPGFIHWHACDSSGNVVVSVGGSVYRIDASGDKAVPLAHDLLSTTETFSFLHERHAMMGVWTDAEGATYLSVYAGQEVKRISTDGNVAVVYRSSGEWSPCGGMAANDGSTWILEWSTSNQVRLTRLDADGAETVY